MKNLPRLVCEFLIFLMVIFENRLIIQSFGHYDIAVF